MSYPACWRLFCVYAALTGISFALAVPVPDGLVLHVSADSLAGYGNGDSVSVWPDLSGYDNHAVQDNASYQPVIVPDELNGKPVLRFDGIDDYFSFPELPQVGTVFVVLREHPDAAHDYRPFISHALPGNEPANWHRGGNREFWSSQWGQPVVYNGQTKVDGVNVNGLTTLVPTSYALVSHVNVAPVPANQIGRDRSFANRVWYGEIAEMLLYNRLLNAYEENDVGWYLAQKYGLSTAYEPGELRALYPPNGSAGITAASARLSWTPFPDADSYRVYAGASLPLTFRAAVSEPFYESLHIPADQATWFWQVEAFSGETSLALGDVWSFDVFHLWSLCPLISDLDGDCTITLADLVLFAEQWLAPPGCVGFEDACADFDGDDGVSLDDFSVLAQEWQIQSELSTPVIINEIHYDPDLSYELVEFVELFNAGDRPIDISGWYFSRGIDYTFPPNTVIDPGGYIVVTEDTSIRTLPPLTTVHSKFGTPESNIFGPFSGSLSNDGETLQLRTANGDIADEVDYKAGFPWPTVGGEVSGPGTGHSIQLVNPAFENDRGGNWRSAYPTPGAANTAVYAANHPPVIRQIHHTPRQPNAGETVTITAKITDTDGVASVTLHYQIVDPGDYIPITLPNLSTATPALPNPAYEDPANWISVPMNDDGIDGDLTAGDDVYTVLLPAGVQAHRRLIRYRITAVDNGQRSLTVPYPDDPQPNFAYFVYDGVPSWTGEGQTYSTETLTSLPVYHLISRNSDVETCFWNTSWNTGVYHFAGTLVYDGDVYDHIIYRIRGQVSTYMWGKNKIRIKFNRNHWFQARDDYGNKYENTWRRLVLVSGTCPWWQYPHPSGTWDVGTGGMLLNEPLSYRLYKMAQIPAPHTNFFHFRVIDTPAEDGSTQYDGDFWGLYIAVEEPDRRFLREHNLEDGNIYKPEGGINQKRQSATQVIDGSDVVAFINGQNASSPQSWWQDNVNLDWYYRFRTVNIAVNNSDMRPQANCFYYCDPITGKWSIHPWDMDLTFEWGWHYTTWENIRHSLQYPQLNIAYRNRARELVDLLFDNDHYGWRQTDQLVDELAAVIDRPVDNRRFVDAEKALWNNHPRVTSRYKNLWFEHNEFFDQPGRSKDWDNMLAYYKQYLTPEGMSGFLGGSFGPHALLTEIADPVVPDKPSLTYIGSEGYPVNDLRFQTSAFSAPQGGGTFAALMWRIAEVEPPQPAEPPVVKRGKYEIETLWETPEMTDPSQLSVQIPSGVVSPGRHYRVRSRMKDSTGRWSHWSDPVQFTPGSAPLLHYWHFNGLTGDTVISVPADYSVLGSALLTYPGDGDGYMDSADGSSVNARLAQDAGQCLRVRNPSDTRQLILTLPATGYRTVQLSYAVMRTNNGAQTQTVQYRTSALGDWQTIGDITVPTDYELFSFDFSHIPDVDNNPEFAVRILFGGDNASGASGNNRFDNITLEGLPLEGTNQPPHMVEPIPFTEAIVNTPAHLDLSAHFHDPDGDVLTFTAAADKSSIVQPTVSGHILTLTPQYQGDAVITVTAADGHNPPVETTFRLLAYPPPHALHQQTFGFGYWSSLHPEHMFPDHMLFLQSNINDPGVTQPLEYAYYVPHNDYHADDQDKLGYPYMTTGRTRLNGLFDEGISFINTGRGRDLGGALAALDTTGLEGVRVSWLAGTILENFRRYAIRLQYRVGIDGSFIDVLDGDDRPVEYVAQTNGDTQDFEQIPLPAEAVGQPYVLVLWRYYHIDVTSGARAQLRLDDIIIGPE